jgi:hypothetical protein
VKDPIDRMRQVFEMRQRMTGLKQFADKAEGDSLERDWKAFVAKVAQPAFDRLKLGVFGDKCQALTEKTDPGFKVKDDPDSEFWFWITFRGRLPVAHAARKFGTSTGLLTGTTPHLSSKPSFEITDITEDDVLNAIAYSYERSPIAA